MRQAQIVKEIIDGTLRYKNAAAHRLYTYAKWMGIGLGLIVAMLGLVSGSAQTTAPKTNHNSICKNNMHNEVIFATKADCLQDVKYPGSYGDPGAMLPSAEAQPATRLSNGGVVDGKSLWMSDLIKCPKGSTECTVSVFAYVGASDLPNCPKGTKCYIFKDMSSGVTEAFDGSVDVPSQTGRVVKISDAEYADLQKLRKAVEDKETEIAKAHAVDFGYKPCYIALDSPNGWCYADLPRPADHYEFRGQFLLINVPTKESK